MNKEERVADMLQMYNSLTDPEQRAKAKREMERDKRNKDKQEDTGV